MRTFKTICHNNIHRNYSSELVTPTDTLILWKDNRPKYTAELKIISAQSIRDLQFEIVDLVVGKEYTMQIDDGGMVSLIGIGEMVMFGSINERSPLDLTKEKIDEIDGTDFGHYSLFEIERPDGLYYREFFYSEEEMRDRKINSVLG